MNTIILLVKTFRFRRLPILSFFCAIPTMEDVQKHSVHTLVFRSLKRAHDMFIANQTLVPVEENKTA